MSQYETRTWGNLGSMRCPASLWGSRTVREALGVSILGAGCVQYMISEILRLSREAYPAQNFRENA